MKLFYSILFLLAMIVAFTAGVQRSNQYFTSRNVGDAKYLTPATTMTNSPSDSSKPEAVNEAADSVAAGQPHNTAPQEGGASHSGGH